MKVSVNNLKVEKSENLDNFCYVILDNMALQKT